MTPPTAVYSVNLAKALTINADSSPTFSILIDVESPIYISEGSAASGSTILSGTSAIQIPGWAIIPFVGTGSPTVETYDVTFATNDLGPKAAYGLRVTTVKDSAGLLYGAAWVPVYGKDYTFGTAVFQPQILENLLTVANGAGYTLTTNPANCTATTANNVIACMKFATFLLSTHTGTVTIGATDYTYTATKR